MTHKFSVGQRVVIVRSPVFPDRVGMVTTIVADLERMESPTPESAAACPPDTMVHRLAIPATLPGRVAVSRPEWLEPYLPDHAEKAEWTDELSRLCRRRVRA